VGCPHAIITVLALPDRSGLETNVLMTPHFRNLHRLPPGIFFAVRRAPDRPEAA
jgi:hypothetical protein